MNTPPSGSGQDAELVRALVRAQDLCARLDAERAAAELKAANAKAHAAVIEDSIAFRLGSLLLATRSVKGLAGFPRGLASLIRHWRTRKTTKDGGEPAEVSAAAPASAQLPGAALARAWHQSRRPDPPASLRNLRMAAVVDEFTEACFAPDCTLLNLPVDDFERQLDEFQPHLLFVESAWRGKSGGWMHKVYPCSGELRRLVDACRRRGIPTVFWCKEDPSHFDNFIEAAALFDQVFTTDSDCVPRYRERLGHDRVDVLGFACQPAIHNPIEAQSRDVAACFAGSWYAKYPDRARDFEALVNAIQQVMPVKIYDRNHARHDPSFAFPEKYLPMIQGGVAYEQVAEVYKACEFAITVNTITHSPTMFARRVFEILACNAIAISNSSVGLDRVLGDLVLMAGRDDLATRLLYLRQSLDARHRLRLRGLRHVMSHHTTALRLSQISASILEPLRPRAARVWVVAAVNSEAQVASVTAMFRSQKHGGEELLLLAPQRLSGTALMIENARFISSDALNKKLRLDAGWVAIWHHEDYYGPSYLLDMLHAISYSREKVITKSTFFRATPVGVKLEADSKPYSRTARIYSRRSIIATELLAHVGVEELVGGGVIELGVHGLSVDEYGYCMQGAQVATASLVDVED